METQLERGRTGQVQKRRRNNAPVRPRRPATTVPDLLFAIAMGLFVMSGVFFIASFTDDNLSNGDAGTQLARIFSGTLFLSSIFIFLLGILLLRDERTRLDHFTVPLVIGAIVGVLEAAMFLNPQSALLLVGPLLLLVFALRPVRAWLAGLVSGRAKARR